MSLAKERVRSQESFDIEEAAKIRLQVCPYRAIRRCSCSFEDGTLRLFGNVPTYHYKQIAQVAVTGLDGVLAIVNDIQVDSAP